MMLIYQTLYAEQCLQPDRGSAVLVAKQTDMPELAVVEETPSPADAVRYL